jgi:hypothetical protein
MQVCPECNRDLPWEAFRSLGNGGIVRLCNPCEKTESRKKKTRRRLKEDPALAKRIRELRERINNETAERELKFAKNFIPGLSRHLFQQAHRIYQKALKDGSLVRGTCCEDCGKTEMKIIGHHTDYAKPTEVVWLCESCHSLRHWKRS